jgi:hypothetical protein
MSMETRDQAEARRMVRLRRQLGEIAERRRWHSMNNFEPSDVDDLAGVLTAVPEEHHQAIRAAVAEASNVAHAGRERLELLNEVASAAAAVMPGQSSALDRFEDPRELARAVPRMYDQFGG